LLRLLLLVRLATFKLPSYPSSRGAHFWDSLQVVAKYWIVLVTISLTVTWLWSVVRWCRTTNRLDNKLDAWTTPPGSASSCACDTSPGGSLWSDIVLHLPHHQSWIKLLGSKISISFVNLEMELKSSSSFSYSVLVNLICTVNVWSEPLWPARHLR
jgi:hypothetical protein